MTRNAAAVFYDKDKESAGFLLFGSKSRHQHDIEQFFVYENSIGFFNATVSASEKGKQLPFHAGEIFSEIASQKEYQSVPLLSAFERYTLLMGKRTKDTLELYTLCNPGQDRTPKAKLQHTITNSSYVPERESLLWYSPDHKNIFELPAETHLDLLNASDNLTSLLTVLDAEPNYRPEIVHRYALCFDSIHKLEQPKQP